MKKLKSLTVKVGTADEFMVRTKDIMHAADKKEPIQLSHTLIFEDLTEMQYFLNKTKSQLSGIFGNDDSE